MRIVLSNSSVVEYFNIQIHEWKKVQTEVIEEISEDQNFYSVLPVFNNFPPLNQSLSTIYPCSRIINYKFNVTISFLLPLLYELCQVVISSIIHRNSLELHMLCGAEEQQNRLRASEAKNRSTSLLRGNKQDLHGKYSSDNVC